MNTADSNDSRAALYAAIEEAAKDTNGKYEPQSASRILLELSYAWRALYGGAQPGSSVVEK
jgi:hypothetical protein